MTLVLYAIQHTEEPCGNRTHCATKLRTLATPPNFRPQLLCNLMRLRQLRTPDVHIRYAGLLVPGASRLHNNLDS